MKTCKKCGKENKDTAKFCAGCGARFDEDKEESEETLKSNAVRKNKRFLVGVCLLIAVALCITGLVITSIQKRKESALNERYVQTVSLANKAIENLDYQQAEQYGKEALQLDAERPEAYSTLYESYYAREQDQMAQQVKEKAESTLAGSSLDVFSRQIQKIQNEYQTVSSYTVLKELGKMEMTPIFAGTGGWLIRKDDEYSIMDEEGEIVPGYTDPYTIVAASSQQKYIRTCLGPGFQISPETRQWPEPNEEVSNVCVPLGIIGPQPEYELGSDDKPKLTEKSLEGYRVFNTEPPEPTQPIYLRKRGQVSGDYYIYNPAKDELLGPYQEDEAPAFGLLAKNFSPNDTNPQKDQVYLLSFWQYLYSPFWSRGQLDGADSYTVYSSDGTITKEGYDQAVVVDSMSLGVMKNGVYSLLDQNLEEEYSGWFEDGSSVIGNRALIKTDGSWKLVKFGDSIRAKNYLGETADSTDDQEPEEEPAKEPAEEPEENETSIIPSEAVGTYWHFSGAGAWRTLLDVKADGTYTYDFSDADMGQDENGKGITITSRSVFHGRLEPEYDDQGNLVSLKVTEKVYDKEPGSVEVTDNGDRNEYITEDKDSFKLGSVLKYYPIGTPWNAFTMTEQSWLLPADQQRDVPVTQPVLVLTTTEDAFVIYPATDENSYQ